MPFTWHLDSPPPAIEEHSRAKLQVLRLYLARYLDRLGSIPARDEFKLDLVDGFAGGGIFRDGDHIISGTPLIMLEESRNARHRLNESRTKSLRFDCKFHFVDVNPDHIDHLRRALADRGYKVDGDDIGVRNASFDDVADEIIASILDHQPRAGRAIFLLDQTGFSQIETGLVKRIFSRLPRAEVILTFAADSLLNHLAERPQLVRATAPLEFTESQIQNLVRLRNEDGGRAVAQRVMRQHIHDNTGATYDTPFFIRPKQSRRALWFLHLSRHPTARDVMIQCHWDSFNAFEHYGSGSFDMMGWDALNSGTLPLFHFEEFEANQLRDQLLDSMPAEFYPLVAEGPITVETMHHELANRTAARFHDLDHVVLELARQREFEIRNAEGKPRSLSLKRLSPDDRIALPRMRMFPVFASRRSLNNVL